MTGLILRVTVMPALMVAVLARYAHLSVGVLLVAFWVLVRIEMIAYDADVIERTTRRVLGR